ncbi:zinc finger TRAF-type-containing protein 1-like [Drosophila nasuta]|uniref:zinc finger TRAF-type-containing protein 1-like n=1 Tax=Drosophila nasuta TaxID=42062 RepID=UPI00295EA4DB|nr:zinc finger TRAF-type-containing protein 1-like [Drosophila nasuta]
MSLENLEEIVSPRLSAEDEINTDVDSEDEINNVPAASGVFVHGLRISGDLDNFRCIVCNTVPFSKIYECNNGHLICAGCYQIRVLDKMLGSQMGTCSQCGVRIYRQRVNRNTDVEQQLAEAVVACEKCNMHLPRCQLRLHSLQDCCNRLTTCKYKRIGCKWKGKVGVLEEAHNENCEFRHKKAEELLKELRKMTEKRDKKTALRVNVMRFLQMPQITARMVHLIPTDETFLPNVFTTCQIIDAFNRRWSVEFMWRTANLADEPNEEETDPCTLLFQLCLYNSGIERSPLGLSYTLLSSTYSDIRFQANLCMRHDFSRDNPNGPVATIYENSWHNINRLLNKRGFYARLLMARI